MFLTERDITEYTRKKRNREKQREREKKDIDDDDDDDDEQQHNNHTRRRREKRKRKEKLCNIYLFSLIFFYRSLFSLRALLHALLISSTFSLYC